MTSNATSWNGDWYDESGGVDDQGIVAYNPYAPVDRAHQQMELAVVCIADALAVLIIAGRTYMRKKKLKTLRADDWWIIAAGLVLLFIWWPAQISANHFGSGLHWMNLPEEDKKAFWISTWGFSGYYIVTSLIKVSICQCHLGLMPKTFVKFRRAVKGLCVFILLLGLTETLLWNLDCQPFLSNFVWEIPGETCWNLDGPRYMWVGLSIVIDLIILWIPFRILQDTKLQTHEKKALMFVFAANLMGTIVCAIGIYGIWDNTYQATQGAYDSVFSETNFLMVNNIEALMYTLGASFPVLSPYLVAKAGQSHSGRFQISSLIPSLRKKFSSSSSSVSDTEGSSSKESILDNSRGWEEIGLDPKNAPVVGITSVADVENQLARK